MNPASKRAVRGASTAIDRHGHEAAIAARSAAYLRHCAALAAGDSELERAAREEITEAQLLVARAEYAMLAQPAAELQASRVASESAERKAHDASERVTEAGRGVVPRYLAERLELANAQAARARSAAMESRNRLARLMNEDAARIERRAFLERQFPTLRSDAA